MSGATVVIRRAIPKPVVRALKRTLPARIRSRLSIRRQWAVGLYAGPSPLALVSVDGNPIMTAADVTDVDAAFVADPFATERDGTWYLFAEVMDRTSGRGVIAVATSTDLATWTYRRVVLREPFHLSYPQLVECDGEIYLMPEAAESGSVLLYRADRFPYSWERVGPVLTGSAALLDPTVFTWGGRWWMLVGGGSSDDELRLYFSNSLTGPWDEHPASPVVVKSPRGARPAGSVVAVGGQLFRFAQDSVPAYGSRTVAFEITELTETTFGERPISEPVLVGSGHGWNAAAMHHIDAHRRPDGSWIAFVDGSS